MSREENEDRGPILNMEPREMKWFFGGGESSGNKQARFSFLALSHYATVDSGKDYNYYNLFISTRGKYSIAYKVKYFNKWGNAIAMPQGAQRR